MAEKPYNIKTYRKLSLKNDGYRYRENCRKLYKYQTSFHKEKEGEEHVIFGRPMYDVLVGSNLKEVSRGYFRNLVKDVFGLEDRRKLGLSNSSMSRVDSKVIETVFSLFIHDMVKEMKMYDEVVIGKYVLKYVKYYSPYTYIAIYSSAKLMTCKKNENDLFLMPNGYLRVPYAKIKSDEESVNIFGNKVPNFRRVRRID
jgi:hypothetical protein